jgi:hypothetical protein
MEQQKVQQMIEHGNFNIEEFIESQFAAEIAASKKKSVSRSPKQQSPKH